MTRTACSMSTLTIRPDRPVRDHLRSCRRTASGAFIKMTAIEGGALLDDTLVSDDGVSVDADNDGDPTCGASIGWATVAVSTKTTATPISLSPRQTASPITGRQGCVGRLQRRRVSGVVGGQSIADLEAERPLPPLPARTSPTSPLRPASR